MRTYRNSTAGSGRHVSACFKARRVHGEGPVVALHLCTHTCINMMFDMYVYRSPRVHIPWRHACENMLAQCPHRIAPYTLFDTCSHASKADPIGLHRSVVNIFFSREFAFPKIFGFSGRIGKRARAAPCCARCTPRAALTRSASHAAAPRPCAQHHSACAGPRRRAAHRGPILKN